MRQILPRLPAWLLPAALHCTCSARADNYQNFHVAVYVRAYGVQKMAYSVRLKPHSFLVFTAK